MYVFVRYCTFLGHPILFVYTLVILGWFYVLYVVHSPLICIYIAVLKFKFENK